MRLPNQLVVNSREAPVARIKQLIIGSDDLGSGPVVLIDLHSFPEFRHNIFSRSEVVGILGLDVLQKYSGVIDFGKRQLWKPRTVCPSLWPARYQCITRSLSAYRERARLR